MKNNKIKIAFFDSKPYDIESFELANKDFDFKLKFFKNHLTQDTAVMADKFDVVCVFVNDEINSQAIEKILEGGVKLIALRCAGYNNVDIRTAYKKIHIVRVPAYSPNAVAEHAVALMLTLNRKIHKAYSRTRESNFNINGLQGFDMKGKTAGIIGTGKIGKTLIEILRGFGMRILAFDPYPDTLFAEKTGTEYTDIEKLYRESDIISLHSPLTKETYHMINPDSISLMKDGVMIINTGRGQLIDSKALIRGLKSQKIGYAGLDVYEEESDYFFEDFSASFIHDDTLARLLSFPNVIVTSHQGFLTREALRNIADITLQNITDYFSDKPLINEICYKCNEKTCAKKESGRCF